jgi:hypothetical protein
MLVRSCCRVGYTAQIDATCATTMWPGRAIVGRGGWRALSLRSGLTRFGPHKVLHTYVLYRVRRLVAFFCTTMLRGRAPMASLRPKHITIFRAGVQKRQRLKEAKRRAKGRRRPHIVWKGGQIVRRRGRRRYLNVRARAVAMSRRDVVFVARRYLRCRRGERRP